MNDREYPYRETLLQWIWQELEFDTHSLSTTEGEPIEIITPGVLNHGAGPDFSGAECRIGSLKVFGDVEIHIHPYHWAQHQHQASDQFNRVILHVVYSRTDDSRQTALRPDGTSPPLLELKPHLQKSLSQLIDRKQKAGLPCSGQVRFLNQRAFEAQIEKAHRHYFEYKTNSLLSYYDSSLPLTKAWLGMLLRGLFNTLGIAGNRSQMADLYSRLNTPEDSSLYEFICHAEQTAFQACHTRPIQWNHSGMRPASRPAKRVPQAAALCYVIHTTHFKTFLSARSDVWPDLLSRIPEKFRPGAQMNAILKNTVFLPALYLLGEFLHAKRVKAYAYQSWLDVNSGLPAEVTRPFTASGFELNKHTRKPGLAHQLKRYCRPLNCDACEVFKKAISS